MNIEDTEKDGDAPKLSLAGALLEQFRAVRRMLAEAYGVDESVALETAIFGAVDEDCETDEEWTERDIKKNPQKEVNAAWRDHVKFHGNTPTAIDGMGSANPSSTRSLPYYVNPYRYEKPAPRIKSRLKAGGVSDTKAGHAAELSAAVGPELAAALYASGSRDKSVWQPSKDHAPKRIEAPKQSDDGKDARDREMAANKQRFAAALKASRAAAKEKHKQLTAQHSDGEIKGHAE